VLLADADAVFRRYDAAEALVRLFRAGVPDAAGAPSANGMSRMEFTLRFTLSHPDIHTTIVGTGKVAHLQENLEAAKKGPLPAQVYAEAKRRLDAAVA